MEYINAELLRKDIDNWKEAMADAVGEYSDGVRFALTHFIFVLDSLRKEQPIQINTLTWKDINDLERIINNVHYEFRNGIGEKSFGEEVLERFREERDEQEQPEVDLEKEIATWIPSHITGGEEGVWKECREAVTKWAGIVARHFYELGLKAREEQMIKEAMECELVCFKDRLLAVLPMKEFRWTIGDKVRIIIAKEDNK